MFLLGHLAIGLKLVQEAIKRRKAVYMTEEHPSVAAAINNEGIIYRKMGQKEKALQWSLRGLELKRKTHAPEKSIALSLEDVAQAFTVNNRHEEALDSLKEAFTILDKNPELYAETRAYAFFIEGKILRSQARYSEAITKFQSSLRITVREAHHHLYSSKLYFQIAQCHFALKDYRKAICFFNKSLQFKHVIHKDAAKSDCMLVAYVTAMQCCIELEDNTHRQLYRQEAYKEADRLTELFAELGDGDRVNEIKNMSLQIR